MSVPQYALLAQNKAKTKVNTDQPNNPHWDWSQTYSAQIGQTSTRFGFVDHLKVKRHDHKGGIGWDVLQRIKQDVLGSDVLAVEFYPPSTDVVNELNMRHLWVVPEALERYFRDVSLKQRSS